MNDELLWNKVFGALLGVLLLVFGLRQVSEMIFAVNPPKVMGDKVAIQETASADGAEVADTMPDWGAVLPTANVANGATISNKCMACHNLASGGPNEIGPNLWGVIGRKPGTHAGFAYSSAMTGFGAKTPVWDFSHVYDFLKGPQAYIDGTKMSFVGLKQRQDRIDLIAWLRQQSSSPVPIPAPDPKAAAAAKAPANAPASSAPASKPSAGVPTTTDATSGAKPTAVAGAAPVNDQTSNPTGQTPASGAAAQPSRSSNVSPGGPPH